LCGFLAVGLLLSAGCKDMMGKHDDSKMSSKSDKSLYDRLGGHDAVAAVVHDFVGRAANDPKVNFTRNGHPNHWEATPENVARLERHLTQFIEQNTGGPQKYEGRDMVTVHRGMEISESEFGAAAADLASSLDKFKVPLREKTELMNVVASTHDQIVGK
jgi:hemoglobin